MSKRWTKDEEAELKKLYGQGWECSYIAARLNRTNHSVWQKANRMNLFHADSMAKRVEALYKFNLSTKCIAEIVGLSYRQTHRHVLKIINMKAAERKLFPLAY